MLFLSLVGTQVMAVLNPLLAMIQQGERPEKVELLTTKKSYNNAEVIKLFLIDRLKYSKQSINIREISDSDKTDGDGRKPAYNVVDEITRGLEYEFFFNIAGGMNFQVAACIYIINPLKCIFIYPESKGIYKISLKNGQVNYEIYNLPEPVDVFELQGIKYNLVTHHNFLTLNIDKCNIKLPYNVMRHLQIGNVLFDLVWNTGNEIKFLKLIHSSKKYNKNDEYYREEARKVIDLVLDRKRFGELYHRSITILTNHQLVAERIKEEGIGKIAVIYFTTNISFCDEIKAFFAGSQTTPITRPELFEKTNNPINKNSILYTSLGKDITTTLIAIWSHKPHTVNIFYTPEDTNIVRYRDAILKNKNILPVAEIYFHPVSIAGYDILDISPPTGKELEVNITPGTKGQTTFLSLFAKAHKAKIFSIETKSQKLRSIPDGSETKELISAPPVMYLKLTGVNVKEYGKNKGALLNEEDLFKEIINFLTKAVSEGKTLKGFPNRKILLKEMKFYSNNEIAYINFFHSSKKIEWSLKDGEWFEKLIGYIFAKSGADDVQVRVKTQWSASTEKHLKQKYKMEPHKSDIDVVARFKTNYCVISCKSGKKEKTEKTATEISAIASLFGRFTTPFIAFLQYEGEPFKSKNGVNIFGIKTLIDTDSMKSLISEAINEKKK